MFVGLLRTNLYESQWTMILGVSWAYSIKFPCWTLMEHHWKRTCRTLGRFSWVARWILIKNLWKWTWDFIREWSCHSMHQSLTCSIPRKCSWISWAPSSFFIKSSLRVYRKCSWSSLVSFEHSSVSFWSEVDGKCSQPKNRWDMFLASTLCADSLSILYSIILENQWEMSLVLPEPNPSRFLMKYLLEMYVGCPWSSLR